MTGHDLAELQEELASACVEAARLRAAWRSARRRAADNSIAVDDTVAASERGVAEIGRMAHDQLTRAETAEAELGLLHAGEEPYEDERLSPTAAQWIWHWNRATPEERMSMAEHRVDLLERFHECLNDGHKWRIAEYDQDRQAERARADQAEARLRAAEARIFAAQAVLDSTMGCASHEAAGLRAAVREALHGPTEGPTCCVCGTTTSTPYFNHLNLPFCPHCADCQCGQTPCIRTGTGTNPFAAISPIAPEFGPTTVPESAPPPSLAAMYDLAQRAHMGFLVERLRLESAIVTAVEAAGLTIVRRGPVEEVAAHPGTVNRLRTVVLGCFERLDAPGAPGLLSPVVRMTDLPVIADESIPPGEVHLRPHPRPTDGPS